MPQYHIWTIGCQMNKAESERLGSYLEQLGYQTIDTVEKADFIVLNSCVVRQSAENRVINKLNALKTLKKLHPEITVSVTGCLVNSQTDQLRKKFPHVDDFFKPGTYPCHLKESTEQSALPRYPSPCTFVPITQGCDNFCTYCIVPYRRGRQKSRPLGEIACEVRELVRRGVKEVTLLGQNVDSYGFDLPERPDLADLLYELNAIEGLARIRFLTNHPKDMSTRLIEAVASLGKVCKQISLPVQAGSDEILGAMRRGYTVAHYRELVAGICRAIPDVALSTDVIVGFPGESEAQFEETVDLLTDLRFDTVHVAAYSTRPGTIAARELVDDISPAEKKRRLEKIEQLQEQIVAESNARLLGKTVAVLVEGRKAGKWQARTQTGKLVFFTDTGDYLENSPFVIPAKAGIQREEGSLDGRVKPDHDNERSYFHRSQMVPCPMTNYLGQLVNIKIEKTSPWSLQGKVERKEAK